MKKTQLNLLDNNLDSIYWHILNFCEKLFIEQRKINLQSKISTICKEFRLSKYKHNGSGIKKIDIQRFYEEISNLKLEKTDTVRLLNKDLTYILKNFDKYYDDETGTKKFI